MLRVVLVGLIANPAFASPEAAVTAYREGFALQKEMRTLEAIAAYEKALTIDPFHAPSHYEIGWSYWVLADWKQVVRHWETALELDGGVEELPDYLAMAKRRLTGDLPPLVRVPIGTQSEGKLRAVPGGSPAQTVRLDLAARFQHYNPKAASPADHFDRHIFSPKSVIFSADGAKAYVNALEGLTTVVYDTRSLTKRGVITHRFNAEEAADPALFHPEDTQTVLADYAPLFARLQRTATPNEFDGKPVEGVLTHQGRFLWVSYYRRHYDRNGVLPSAMAIIDTRTDRIVRVLPTGPIPKYLAASPDGHWLAVVHWGDNSVGLVDIRGDDPAAFHTVGDMVVERRLRVAGDADGKIDRDRLCGFCLRGAVFTPDSQTLLVGRMGGGGVAVLDVPRRKLLGSVWGMRPTPRHLVLSADGTRLYVGSNASGAVAVYHPADLIAAAKAGRRTLAPLQEVRTGIGTRTIDLSPDGRLLFAAVNTASELSVLDAATLAPVLTLPADSYPVGLGVSPDGSQLWVTSQGRDLRGGNSVMVFRITRSEG